MGVLSRPPCSMFCAQCQDSSCNLGRCGTRAALCSLSLPQAVQAHFSAACPGFFFGAALVQAFSRDSTHYSDLPMAATLRKHFLGICTFPVQSGICSSYIFQRTVGPRTAPLPYLG